MISHSITQRILSGIVVTLSVLAVAAQSGRRQPAPVSPAPIPSPTPEQSPKASPTPVPGISFLVALDSRAGFNFYPVRLRDAVVDSCAARLRSESSASVEIAQQDLTRGEAIKKAKASDETYVVFLNLGTEALSSSETRDSLTVEFVLFAPKTAEVKITGTTYQRNQARGPVVVGPRNTGNNAMLTEQLLRRAAEDAADSILKALHLTTRGTPPIH